MDEIETRLKESADDCIKAYEGWSGQKKNPEARERLQEATHELRKVAARLEIEIAASERDDMTQRPIPIPPHRSSNRRPGSDLPEFLHGGAEEDNTGNVSENFGNSDRQPRQNQSRPPQRQGGGGFQRRPMRSRPHGGGGGNGGGNDQPSGGDE